MNIDFIDLNAQQKRIKSEIDAGIAKVLSEGRYIMGPEVEAFEAKLANYGQAKYALGCANGTDALLLPLMAWNIGPGEAVFCPSFSYCATAEVIAHLGATPVFVDIDRETYNVDPESLKQAIADVKSQGELTPRAIISVDLFGQSANYDLIQPIARENRLKLIADSAQAFGTTLHGKHPAAWADIATTSFYPAKPLGCYGDGGAVITDDEETLALIKSLRNHGQGVDKYDNVRIGLNSRLDTLQAAILLPKLAIFTDELAQRQQVASRYIKGLQGNVIRVPRLLGGTTSTWAQFTIEVPDPVGLAEALGKKGIPTARYYPMPIHMQTAYEHFPCASGGLPNTMACRTQVISLPMHPYLDTQTQDFIIEAVRDILI